MEHQLVGGVEAALHQHKGAFTALFLALADRVYVAVLGVDRRVKRHAGQIHILPAAVLALVVGNRRQLIRREVAAVRDVVFLDQRILVGHKADTDAAEIAGQIFLRDEIFVGQRFGNALVADAVDARDTPSTKVLPVTLPSSGSSTIPAIAPIRSAALSIMTMARQFSMVAPLPTMPPTCFTPDRRPLAQLSRIVDLLIPATPPTPVASSASRVPKPCSR